MRIEGRGFESTRVPVRSGGSSWVACAYVPITQLKTMTTAPQNVLTVCVWRPYYSTKAHNPMLGAVGSPIQIGGVNHTNNRIAITIRS